MVLAVDYQPFEISFARQNSEHLIKNAHLNPAIVTPLDRAIVPKSFGQVAPRARREDLAGPKRVYVANSGDWPFDLVERFTQVRR